MPEGTKRRLKRILKYAALVALTGLVNGNLMCFFTWLYEKTGHPGFTFGCLFTVLFSSALFYITLFRKKDINNIYKLAALAVSYLACGTAVTIFYRLWGMSLSSHAAAAAGRQAYIMFVTYLPIDIVFLLVCYLIYMTVKIARIMKEEPAGGTGTVSGGTEAADTGAADKENKGGRSRHINKKAGK